MEIQDGIKIQIISVANCVSNFNKYNFENSLWGLSIFKTAHQTLYDIFMQNKKLHNKIDTIFKNISIIKISILENLPAFA